MAFMTNITTNTTDWPTEGQDAQAAREEAVRKGYLPQEQAPHVPVEPPIINTDQGG